MKNARAANRSRSNASSAHSLFSGITTVTPAKISGAYPADVALGLEGSSTPGLARWIGLEVADESSYLKAEHHLAQTGGIPVSARQIQRVVQRVGNAAQQWQQRPAQPGVCAAPILYVSADGTGVPVVSEDLAGRRGKQADGTAKSLF